MIVGASPESDYQILRLTEGLYQNYQLKRVFYSAYIPDIRRCTPAGFGHKAPAAAGAPGCTRQTGCCGFYHHFRAGAAGPGAPQLRPLPGPQVQLGVQHYELFPHRRPTAPPLRCCWGARHRSKSAQRIRAAPRQAALNLRRAERTDGRDAQTRPIFYHLQGGLRRGAHPGGSSAGQRISGICWTPWRLLPSKGGAAEPVCALRWINWWAKACPMKALRLCTEEAVQCLQSTVDPAARRLHRRRSSTCTTAASPAFYAAYFESFAARDPLCGVHAAAGGSHPVPGAGRSRPTLPGPSGTCQLPAKLGADAAG